MCDSKEKSRDEEREGVIRGTPRKVQGIALYFEKPQIPGKNVNNQSMDKPVHVYCTTSDTG